MLRNLILLACSKKSKKEIGTTGLKNMTEIIPKKILCQMNTGENAEADFFLRKRNAKK